jgi:protein-S-isoprenylcysteine O-methyltransferase Ste14
MFDRLIQTESHHKKFAAWCDGAIETVYSFLLSHRSWHEWIKSSRIGQFFFLNVCLLYFALIFIPKDWLANDIVITAWLAAFLVAGMLYFAKSALLPGAVLRLANDHGFVRRHAGDWVSLPFLP